jgi:hypothetical protein
VTILACPVCFGASSGPMIEGSAAGIVTLMAITVVVLGGLGAFLLFLRRQARRAAMPAGGDAAHGRS